MTTSWSAIRRSRRCATRRPRPPPRWRHARPGSRSSSSRARWAAASTGPGSRWRPWTWKYYGGEPANFLDIGGSSNPRKVVDALRIITADPTVRAILFNIFGGITRCDDVANGIVEATRQLRLTVPLVIRLTGTNEELAVRILTEAGFSALTDMDEAVKQAVAQAGA